MDRYSHNYANEQKRKAPKSKVTYFLVLAIFIAMVIAIYVYHPFSKVLHATYEKFFAAPKDEVTADATSHQPKVRFEFYTTLANSKITEQELPVAITSHEELEKSLSQVIHPRRNDE